MQLHSSFIAFTPIAKEITIAEETEKKEKRIENTVVLFIAVEKGDDATVAQRAINDAHAFLQKLKVSRIVLYPYAHLSSNLAKPTEALKLVKNMGAYAKQIGIETYRAPFGWNKQFTISIKGHPLAEQSRFYAPTSTETTAEAAKEADVPKALKDEEKLVSLWHVLQPDDKLVPVEKFDFKGHKNLDKFAKYEIKKVRASQQMPPHVPLMKRLEIADYERGSDPGNLRWYPKGRLVKSLLEQFVTSTMVAYGAMEVETPIMYD
ncbi:threonine--tRNA ligase, partial [Candidatus Bathyarchaeota archaeon]|nr:threonine--tRNA ligase [Candidatus Bathyarchaeota archaeon]